MELLAMFKNSIGDLSNNADLDKYYTNFLEIAKSDLITDDISANIIETELGKTTTVVYAELLMNKQDIATNSTLNLLKNKLANMTKGERYS